MNQSLPKLAAVIFTIAIFVSCRTSSYYTSPVYGSSITYHALPFKTDSIKSSLYAGGNFAYAYTNTRWRDRVVNIQGNIYKAHQFNIFKAWYGAGLSAGNYKVANFEATNTFNPLLDTASINRLSGNKFFGSANVSGGAVIGVPFGTKVEWRILGVLACLSKEFGSYLHFRNIIKRDSIKVDGVAKKSSLVTLGYNTEFAFKTHTGEFSLLFQFSTLLGKDNKVNDRPLSLLQGRYMYFTNGYSLTFNRSSVSMMSSLGKRLLNVQLGYNYKLSQKVKAFYKSSITYDPAF